MEKQLTSLALRAIRRVLRATEQGSRRLAAATGLTPSQLLALQEIQRRGESTPSTLAGVLQFSQATVTSILDRLEGMGLVTRHRSARDKRQILLRMTRQGEDLMEAAPDLLQNRFERRYGNLPEWEQAMILAALERLGELLDASEIDAAPLMDSGVIDRALDTDGS